LRFRILLVICFFFFALSSCTIETGFVQNIDFVFPPVSHEMWTNVSVVVTEQLLRDGLEKGGYSLAEFDHLTLEVARVVLIDPDNGWNHIQQFKISFQNNRISLDVFNFGGHSGHGDHCLLLQEGDMLGLMKDGNFVVDASGLISSNKSGLGFRIELRGTLSATVP